MTPPSFSISILNIEEKQGFNALALPPEPPSSGTSVGLSHHDNPEFAPCSRPPLRVGFVGPLTGNSSAIERFHETRVGIIGDSRNSSYIDAVKGAFLAEYARLDGKASFDLTFDSSKGVPGSDLVAEVRSKGCDGLLAIAASTEVVLMAKELERARLHVQFLLPPWPLTIDLIQNGGAAVEGAVAVSIADLEYRSAAGKAFESAYRSEYGEAPSFTAMFGWEAASVLRAALVSGGPATPKTLSDRIIAIRGFDGLQGKIEFNTDGKATRTMFLFRIDGGVFRRID